MSARDRIKDAGDSRIGAEAARWLLRLQETAADPHARDEAFLDWLAISPRHLRLFLETFQTYRLLGDMDSRRIIDIQDLLKNLREDVIHLRGVPPHTTPVSPPSRTTSPRALKFAAAATLVATIGAFVFHGLPGAGTYSTDIGEQRTCKLDDGSFVYLNTDSRLQVQFSAGGRHVRLLRGEALFVVERDSRRPFVVSTEDAAVEVLGTQFNVRSRTGLTDVAVIEGTVQVTTATGSAGTPARLAAGAGARVSDGHLTRQSVDIDNVLAWRERRLVFTDTPLKDVAAEFNRYNKTRITIEGVEAQKRQFTGIFNADGPQALILYAMKDERLAVEPQGSGWVIRAR